MVDPIAAGRMAQTLMKGMASAPDFFAVMTIESLRFLNMLVFKQMKKIMRIIGTSFLTSWAWTGHR